LGDWLNLLGSAVSDLRKTGVIPDAIICRSEIDIEDDIKEKLALTCDVDERALIVAKNVETIYQVPEYFAKQWFLDFIWEKLAFESNNSDLKNWNKLVAKITDAPKTVKIWVVWKYTSFEDTYKSINEAFIHAWVANDTRVELEWIDAENIKTLEEIKTALAWVSWILVPGGFWERWVEGKILAVQHARENNIPLLGICLGLQVAVIEFARNMCNLSDAHSAEFDDKSQNLVIDFMEEQKDITQKGGTMRQFVEIKDHRFFIATQAHPEFKSRLERPHPLFVGLVKASLER